MRKRGWVPVERLPWEPTRYQSPIPQLFGGRRSKVKDSDMSMSIQKITKSLRDGTTKNAGFFFEKEIF